MNLDWNCLSTHQRRALTVLSMNGPCDLPREVGEQLCNLGLVVPLQVGGYCISALGATLPPARFN